MKRTVAICTGVLFVVMLTTITTYGQQASSALHEQIQGLNKEMAKCLVAGDIEKNLALYTEDAISLPSNEPMLEGIAAIRKSSEEMAKSGTKITSFEPTTLKVIPNGNLVTEIGTYKITVNVPNMAPVNDHGKYLTIWEKQDDGSLKIKVETWNSDVPMMPEQK
jgi:ketosteroid isomerase-like protein